jgi:hypothetical protein
MGVSENVTSNKKRLVRLLTKLKMFINMYPDRCIIVFRTLGIWGLPPDETFLVFIKKFIEEIKIDTVIDYGAGTGLWSRILSDCLDSKDVNIIAYDIFEPLKNINISKQRGFYPVVTKIELPIYTNSILMLIWPPYETRMASRAITTFTGNYVIYYGDFMGNPLYEGKYYTGDKIFHNILETGWELIKAFDPIGKLIDENGEFNDKIYLYKRKLIESVNS